MKSYTMAFDGNVLERGFWLYIWRITTPTRTLFYVGRNGDSSSIHASSPFVRIGQHLDFRENAKGNSLAKRLAEEDVTPSQCDFAMICVGPLFQEQSTREEHDKRRDITAALERDLAQHLKDQGLAVLGTHSSTKPPQPELLTQVLDTVKDFIQEGPTTKLSLS